MASKRVEIANAESAFAPAAVRTPIPALLTMEIPLVAQRAAPPPTRMVASIMGSKFL